MCAAHVHGKVVRGYIQEMEIDLQLHIKFFIDSEMIVCALQLLIVFIVMYEYLNEKNKNCNAVYSLKI